MDGMKIDVVADSSGHCDAWRKKDFSKPNYVGERPATTAVVNGHDSGTETPASSNDTNIGSKGEGHVKEIKTEGFIDTLRAKFSRTSTQGLV